MDTLAVVPQRVLLPRNGDALAACSKFLFQKRGGIGNRIVLLKMRHNPLDAVPFIAAGGQRPPDHGVRDAVGTVQAQLRRFLSRCAPFLGLRLGDRLDLFLHRGEQGKARRRGGLFRVGGIRLHRQRSGGFFARRFVFRLFGCYL